jgi:hypothetical protein
VDAATGVILSEERPKKAPAEVLRSGAHGGAGAREKADKDFSARMDNAKHEKEILPRSSKRP